MKLLQRLALNFFRQELCYHVVNGYNLNWIINKLNLYAFLEPKYIIRSRKGRITYRWFKSEITDSNPYEFLTLNQYSKLIRGGTDFAQMRKI